MFVMKRMEQDAAAVSSSELPRPPPAVGNESIDESLVGYDAGTGRLGHVFIDPERGTETSSASSEPSSVAISSSSFREEPDTDMHISP